MSIISKILAFDPSIGSILVEYTDSTSGLSLTYNIDVPMENGQYVDQPTLQLLITQMEPTGQFARIIASKNATIPEHLSAFIPVPVPIPTVSNTQPVVVGTASPPSA
jgi:hypothetical protein